MAASHTCCRFLMFIQSPLLYSTFQIVLRGLLRRWLMVPSPRFPHSPNSLQKLSVSKVHVPLRYEVLALMGASHLLYNSVRHTCNRTLLAGHTCWHSESTHHRRNTLQSKRCLGHPEENWQNILYPQDSRTAHSDYVLRIENLGGEKWDNLRSSNLHIPAGGAMSRSAHLVKNVEEGRKGRSIGVLEKVGESSTQYWLWPFLQQ